MNPEVHIKTEVVSHANGEDGLMHATQSLDQQGTTTTYNTSTIDNTDLRFNPVTFHNVSQLGKYFVLTNLFQGSNIYTTIPKLPNIKSDTSASSGGETSLILNTGAQTIGLGSVVEPNCTVIQQQQSHHNDETHPIHLQLVDPNAMHSKDESHVTAQTQQQIPSQHNYSDSYTTTDSMQILKADIKPQTNLIDVRNTVVTSGATHDTNIKPLEMLKVNIEDFNQFLNYHEVFGKMTTDSTIITPTLVPTSTNLPPASTSNATSSDTLPHLTDSLSTTSAIIGPISENVCDLCGKLFQYKYQLIVHRRYHNERKPFTCQVCGQAFQNSAELTLHGKSKHIGGSKMYICNVCFHVFPNDASLERHMKRHSADKPFLCNICMRTFNRREHLENHQRTHTGDCPFR